MSEDQPRAFRATLKAGGGYEAPWITVDADDEVTLQDRLDSVTESTLQKVADVANLFQGAYAANTVTAPAAPAAAPAQGATVTQHPAAQGLKTCAHGVRVYKTGTNARGKWAGWLCPTPKGAADKCDPIWE